MLRKTSSEFQIFSMLLLGTVGLILLAVIIGLNTQPLMVTAQEPPPVDAASLEAFGLSLEDIPISVASVDLSVEVSPNSVNVTTGNQTQFTVTITNNGPDPASYVLFYADYPPSMNNVVYQFVNAPGAVSDNKPKETWLIPGPIGVGAGNAVQVTITGTFISDCDTSVENIVTAYPFDSSAEPATDPDNTDMSTVNLTGQFRCFYLPVVQRHPTPTPPPIVFFDDFSNDNSGWPEFDSGECDINYDDDEYRLDVDEDEQCFAFAPQNAELRYGEFEVEAKRRGNSAGAFGYGIYINGEGGKAYYLFIVKPEGDCGWELIRRKNNDSDTVRSGGCVSAINIVDGTNILKIRHTSDGSITVYVNDEELANYQDSSQLTGKGTGVYVQSDDDRDVEVRFDNFTVRNP